MALRTRPSPSPRDEAVSGGRPTAFSAAELRRAIRTVEKAGKSVAGVDFPREGGFRLLFDEASYTPLPKRGGNEWDEVLPQ